MSFFRVGIVASLAVICSGCLNSTTLLRVKPDGSGTIEQTMLVNAQALKGLMAGMGGKVSDSGGPGVLSEADFKRAAERIGARPVSLTPLKENGFEGAKAIFAFDDITKIRVDQDPMSGSSDAKMTSKTSSQAPIRFEFAKGASGSVLTVKFDEKKAAAAAESAGVKQPPSVDSIDPAMMQMVKTMFAGFKVNIDVEVDGTITKTNADYVNGSRVTLLEIDLASLFEDEAKLKTLQGKIGPGASIAEIKPYLKDMKGMKINHPTVTIEYR